MRRLRVLFVLPLVVVIAFLAFATFFKKVPAATIGVRQMRWGAGGVEARDHPTGLHLGISGIHLWHFLPRRTHFQHFIGDLDRKTLLDRDEVESVQPALEVRTKDNNTVVIDVSIPYRIKEGEAYRIVQDRLTLTYRERVKSTVESVLRSELSKLSSEDIQITAKRLEVAQQTLPVLNEQLGQFHVEADDILLRQIRFTQQYEAKLQEKQFLRQKARLDEALTEQNNMEKEVNEREKEIDAELLKVRREWEKKFQKERSDNQVLIAQIEADAQVYRQSTEAEGDAEAAIAVADGQLAVERALALRDRLRNEALASRGGHIMLALEAVENLHVGSVTLNSDDPSVPMLLDLGQFTDLLVGSSSGEAGRDVGRAAAPR